MKNKILKIILSISFLTQVCPVHAGVGEWTSLGPENSRVQTIALNLDDAVNPQKILIGTEAGVLVSLDFGSTWAPTATQPRDVNVFSLVKVPGVAGKFYAGTDQHGIFVTTDSGATWTALSSQPADLHVSALAIDPTNINTIYAGTAEGLFVSTNSGDSWALTAAQPVDHLTIRALVFDSMVPHKLYVGTYVGIFYTTDGGATWSATSAQPTRTDPPNPRVTSLAMDPVVSGKIYAGTYYEGIFTSEDAGAHWTPFDIQPPTLHPSALMISTATHIPTFYAGIYRSSLHVLQAPGCGNRVVESSRGETCDDGNITSGDGCSTTCEIESTPSRIDATTAAGCSLIPF